MIKWRTVVYACRRGAVLLVHGTNPDFPDRWYAPKGDALVSDDTPHTTAARTLREITGICIPNERFLLVGTEECDRAFPKHHFFTELTQEEAEKIGSWSDFASALPQALFPLSRIEQRPSGFGRNLRSDLREYMIADRSAEQKTSLSMS